MELNSGKLGHDIDPLKLKQGNAELLEHSRKRQIEVKVFELRVAMEDKGYSEKEIEERVGKLRAELQGKANDLLKAGKLESHVNAAVKEKENEKIRRAFEIDDDFVEGR